MTLKLRLQFESRGHRVVLSFLQGQNQNENYVLHAKRYSKKNSWKILVILRTSMSKKNWKRYYHKSQLESQLIWNSVQDGSIYLSASITVTIRFSWILESQHSNIVNTITNLFQNHSHEIESFKQIGFKLLNILQLILYLLKVIILWSSIWKLTENHVKYFYELMNIQFEFMSKNS